MEKLKLRCTCEHPLLVFNAELNKWITVRCGKCPTCKQHTIYLKRQQAENANEYYKYMAMITLTYDEESLPTINITNDGENITINDTKEKIPIDETTFKNLKHLGTRFDKGGWKKIKKYNEIDKLPVIKVKDVQLYLKRIRKHIETKSIKYMALGEYGGNTLRPHYHIIIWSNEEGVFNTIKNNYKSEWGKGRASWQGCGSRRKRHRSNAARYVANYVCSTQSLSRLYNDKSRRPKIWGSCGLYILPYEMDYKKIYTNPTSYFNGEEKTGTNIKKRFNQNLQYSVLPRCTHFDKLDCNSRIGLYEAAYYTDEEEVFKEIEGARKKAYEPTHIIIRRLKREKETERKRQRERLYKVLDVLEEKERQTRKKFLFREMGMTKEEIEREERIKEELKELREKSSIKERTKEEIITMVMNLLMTEKQEERIKLLQIDLTPEEKKELKTKIKQAIRTIFHASRKIKEAEEKTGLNRKYLIKQTINFHEKRDERLLKEKLQFLEEANSRELTRIVYYANRNERWITNQNKKGHEKILQKKVNDYWRTEIEQLHAQMKEHEKHREYNEKAALIIEAA